MTKKEKVREQEKVDDIQRQTEERDRKQKTGKVVHRKRKRQEESIGSEKTKTKKYMFHLENR